MNYSTIMFDLDGTLTDPKTGITKSVQYALAKFGIMQDDPDVLAPFIGPPLMNSFIELYQFSDMEAKTAVEYYREYFIEKGMYENEVYPGVRELLQRIKEQNSTLIVATSKPEVFAKQILEYFQLAPFFDHICGSQLDGTLSDKSELIQSILQSKQVNKTDAVMIGDRKHDIIGAHRNGIASIGVTYGYGSQEELEDIRPTVIVNTVTELSKVLL